MPNVVELKPSNATEAIALSYFKLLVRRDMDGFADIWNDDAVQYIPFPPEGLGKFVPSAFTGKQEIVNHYLVAFKNRRDHIFWIDQIHSTHDPDCVIIEAHARSVIGETNAVYENTYVCVFQIRNGKISELREYANPLSVMRAFRGAFDDHH